MMCCKEVLLSLLKRLCVIRKLLKYLKKNARAAVVVVVVAEMIGDRCYVSAYFRFKTHVQLLSLWLLLKNL